MGQLESRLRNQRLRAFLVERLARLKPEDVGLDRTGGRRRTAKLRQSEVAQLAGVSPAWYARFENGTLGLDVSPAFVQRLADVLQLDERERDKLSRLALPAARAREHLERSAYDGALHALSRIRAFTRKAGSAGSFDEAALLAVEACHDVLGSDCLTLYAPRPGERAAADYATGPRARHWGRLSQQIAFDEHHNLPSARAAVSENMPLPEEIRGPSTLVAFRDARNEDAVEYEFTCANDQWEEINRVRMRSCLVAAVREAGVYRGILSACWAQPRELAPAEVELFATIAAIVDLTALRGLSPSDDPPEP
jgi:transcriptional regulator with XRE-family HTH domain